MQETPTNQSVLDFHESLLAIFRFMLLGGQVVALSPVEDPPIDEIRAFLNRIQEEVDEASEVLFDHPPAKGGRWVTAQVVDAAIDTAYTAFTLALRLAGIKKTHEVWSEVVRANLSKVDGTFGEVQRDEHGKIQKPKGFIHPDVEAILYDYL